MNNEFKHEHPLVTYIRTKTVFQNRLKRVKDYTKVKLYVYELEKLGYNSGPLLYYLKEKGEIWYNQRGHFRALKDGPIDPTLLEKTKKREKIVTPLNDLHLYMREQLMFVQLDCDPDHDDISVYFKAFLNLRDKQIEAFFTVDSFSQRVHTPIVSLKTNLRKYIRLQGEGVVSLDVKQMQPMILAKVLTLSIGTNPFSDAIDKGIDVYVLLQKVAGVPDRSEAKIVLFKLIFGKPMEDIKNMFAGDTKWVDWINQYKSKEEPQNPHKEHTHTNLAWLLQFSEVQVMSEIWNELMKEKIPFLTIHDDVLCQERHRERVFQIMTAVLQKHFKKFTIVIT